MSLLRCPVCDEIFAGATSTFLTLVIFVFNFYYDLLYLVAAQLISSDGS